MPQLQPSLVALEDHKCFMCRRKIQEGQKVYNILMDFRENGEPIFSACCSSKCVNHAIDDHGNEIACQQAR